MKEISAGIIAYYFDKDSKQFKFLVAHPGGPYFKNIKKYGFPKGHQEKNESLKETAIREFKEETGLDIDYLRLKICIENITKKKNVYYFLYPMDEIWDTSKMYSNQFYIEKFQQSFPELDDYKYIPLENLKNILFQQDKKLVEIIAQHFEKHIWKEHKFMPKLNWNQVADEMKRMEKKDSTKLDPNMPIAIRLDMRSGGSFVKGLNKPFDKVFTNAMTQTAIALAEQVQGTQLAYVGSDEITLLLFNNSSKEHFTPFFEGKLQKMVSLTAAIATAEFNKAWYEQSKDFLDHKYQPTPNDYKYKRTLDEKLFKARFDSRAFNIYGSINFDMYGDIYDALTSIWWRVNDVSRNSVQMYARKYFSHKQLNNVKTKDMLNMLQEIGHVWEIDVPTTNKYGNIIIREAYHGFGYNPITKEKVPTIRHKWFTSDEEEMKEFQQVSHPREFVNTKIFKRLIGKK